MKKILKFYIRGFIFLFPIFYLIGVVDGFGMGKNWLLGAGALVGLLIWVIELLVTRKETVKFNWVFWVFLALTVWAGVGFFRLTPGGQMASLMNPLGFGTFGAMLIWLFLWIQVSDKEEFEKQFYFLTAAGIIVGVTSLLAFMIPNSKLPLSLPKNNPLIIINTGFSLSGSMLAELILLVFLVINWVGRLVEKLKSKTESIKYVKEAAIVAFLGLLVLLDVYRLVKTGLIILDGKTAWVIATETLKNKAIFGMGVGNFSTAFNAFKPASFNLTKNWSMGFGISSMGILQWWTELGTIGLLMIVWLVLGVVKQKKKAGFGLLALVLATVLFLPVNLISLFLLVWLLAANGVFEKKEVKLALNVGEKKFNLMPIIIGVILVAGMGFGGYWWTRILLGDIYFRESLVKASKNDGVGTYTSQIKAIGLNPFNADYRKMYAQTNLVIAQGLMSKSDISDDDKQKAATLIQQSVREAKAAVSLNNQNVDYWNNLALIYKSLVGVVDGSPDWSLQAYQQAVSLSPNNPLLMLDMGGLLYAANKLDDADRAFEQVVIMKQDYANGWYNWAYTAKQNKKLDLAVQRLTQALTLVPADSSDFEKASQELAAWKKELESSTSKSAEVNKPSSTNTDKDKTELNVPTTNLQPPITPTVTPGVTVVPTVTPGL